MIRDPETQTRNEAVVEGLTNTDAYVQKEAADGVNEYLRIRAREDGFARQIIPPENVTPADLDRQVDTVKPVIVKDMEPNTPAAYSVPFGTVPMNQYINAPRYRISFDRVMSRRFVADVANLLTFDMDIRQIFNDLMLKDILAEEDRKFLAATDQIVGTLNDVDSTHVTEVASLGYVTVGALNRQSLTDAMKGMPSSNRHLNPARALINNITIWDVVAIDRTGVGGDLSEEMFTMGFTSEKIMGLTWVVTIKTDLVANNVMYQFGAPKYLGDFFIMDDVTVSTKHENYMFEMFAYEMIGGTVKNSGAVCKNSFTGTYSGWTAAEVGSSS